MKRSILSFFLALFCCSLRRAQTAPADILQKIQDYRITSLCAPPTIFRFLIHEDLTKYDLSHLEYCTIAGEALNPAVFDTFKQLTGIPSTGSFPEY